jgi:hypothetical protein
MRKSPKEIAHAFTNREVMDWLRDSKDTEIQAFICEHPSLDRKQWAEFVLETRRHTALRPKAWYRDVAFWMALAAIIIALMSLLRDYTGLSVPSHAPPAGMSSTPVASPPQSGQ